MPLTRAEARAYIASARKKRGINNDGTYDATDLNLADIIGALKLTASQLYPDIFHFIWEILQNADDAKYEAGSTPELRLILTDSYLYAWSNQRSFAQSDVDALCAIGRSSKALDATTIGEKGIGFKSLFKVADKVTVHSDPWHFELNTSSQLGPLGMIVPTWTEEPAGVRSSDFVIPEDGTTLALHLKPDTQLVALQKQLASFDYSFLLFARRLKQLTTYSYCENHRYGKFAWISHKPADTVSLVIVDAENGLQIDKEDFIIASHEVSHMPKDADRQGQSISVAKIAFPVNNWSKPLGTRNSYAFLPIKDFGFRFLIHADFILTANRGDVEHERLWNTKLRAGLCRGIQQTIHDLARKNSSTRPHWPRYVGNLLSIHDPFFKHLAKSVHEFLINENLVRIEYKSSQGECWFQKPRLSAFVGSEFRINGGLLIDSRSMQDKAVVEEYPENSRIALKELGVQQFSYEDFLYELDQLVSRNAQLFQQKPEQWHISLADVLLSFPRYRSSVEVRCRYLQMIPLANGLWVSATKSNVFLPDNEIHEIPSGLTVDFISLSACRNPTRRQFFEFLGVSVCNQRKICELILENERVGHQSTVKALLEQAKFLFLSNYQAIGSRPFRFHDSKGCYGSTRNPMLVPFGKRGRELQQLFAKDFDGVTWLNPAYGELFNAADLERFVSWLVGWDTIISWPSLDDRFGNISPEFRHIFERRGSKTALFHLLERCKANVSLPTYSPEWCRQVGELRVVTEEVPGDNVTVSLSQTVLPRLRDAGEGLVSILDIDCPNDPGWGFLSHFGVSTNLDTAFVLRKLRSLAKKPASHTTKATASKIYIQLGELCRHEENLRKTFASEALVYITSRGWVNISTCRISAAFETTRFPVLSKLYPSCTKLFRSILKTKVADLDDLIEEFRFISSTLANRALLEDQKLLAYQLLRSLDQMLKASAVTSQQIARLKDIPMFPISTVSSLEGTTSFHLKKSSDNFWIADIPVLLELFEGKVELLTSNDEKPLDFLGKIFEVLVMDSRRLTKCVEREPDLGNDSFVDNLMTASLRQKVPYILSIFKKAIESQVLVEQYEAQLGNIRILRVGQFRLRRFVRDVQGVKHYGREVDGDIWPDGASQEMTIYLKRGLHETDCYNLLWESFADYFKVPIGYWRLLSKVVLTSSLERCLEDLQRAGIAHPELNQAHRRSPSLTSESESSQAIEDELQNALQSLTISNPTSSGSLYGTTSYSTSAASNSQTSYSANRTNHISTPSTPIRSVRSRLSSSQQPSASRSSSANVSAPRASRTSDATERTSDLAERLSGVTLTDTTPFRHQMVALSEEEAHVFARSDESTSDSPPARLELTSNGVSDQNREARSENSIMSRILETPSRSSSLAAVSPPLLAGTHSSFQEASRGFSFSFSRPHVNLTPASSTITSRELFNQATYEESGNYLPYEIGRVGERLVYDHFLRKLGSTFDHSCWTSRNRNTYFNDHFSGLEKNFADFTYKDDGGKMKDYLIGMLPNFVEREPSLGITYHLEVKTTMEGLDTNVILSNNQIKMAKKYSLWQSPNGSTQTDLYVLVRVFDLSTRDPPEPKLCLYPDPWSLICSGRLSIEAEGGFMVRPAF